MRPLRLLLSLSTSLTALSLLLYLVFGEQNEEEQHLRGASTSEQKSRFKALFSFTSPGSLFPPSAIISLTDDNSTFFLARPAAFGPALPSTGLSGALWIGSGFGDETMSGGELGCSDVPGWNGGSGDGDMSAVDASSSDQTQAAGRSQNRGHTPKRAGPHEGNSAGREATKSDDSMDDQPATGIRRVQHHKPPAHADIQSLQEGAEIGGKVVLLKRGGCGFLEKVLWAQRRGGVALIVGDDVRGGGLVRMYARGDTSNVTIPALFTSHTTAHLLSSLLPTGGVFQDVTPEEVAKLNLIKSGKGRTAKLAGKPGNKQEADTPSATKPGSANKAQLGHSASGNLGATERSGSAQKTSWFNSVLSAIGLGDTPRLDPVDNSRRPPGSGNLDWVVIDKDGKAQKSGADAVSGKATTGSTPVDFVIGEQDWRDPALLPPPAATHVLQKERTNPKVNGKSGSALPSSGESLGGDLEESSSWLSTKLDSKKTSSSEAAMENDDAQSKHDSDSPHIPEPHEGLWVTLTPTNMSTSPFFDTLLVLVVSPLVTLTVVYALLLLRSRIRRRRWRAPKSLVERLPIRTYHTISDSSPSATPNASSPSTPLLQHSAPRPDSPHSRPRSRTDSESPATSSSFLQPNRTPEEEKRESGLAAWRRRYGGRQRECVVCLEEYEDGVSQVMSLPCGHEFHADCITPWLVTRRRTCPICKGDVVRSLSQSYHDRTVSAIEARFHDEVDEVQAQAAETRNDSPSASRPLPISSDSLAADIEANWADEDDEQGQDIPRRQGGDLSSSLRDVSSSVATTIWRGFEVVGRATGLQRRPSGDGVDRDR